MGQRALIQRIVQAVEPEIRRLVMVIIGIYPSRPGHTNIFQ